MTLRMLGLLACCALLTAGSCEDPKLQSPGDSDPCDPSPCFEGVRCIAEGDRATCAACPPGTEGDGFACADVDACAGDPCFPGVTCTDAPAPGTGFACGPCPSGLEGDGAACTEIDGCAADPCFPGVTCTDVPAPGTGHTCGACPEGLEGDGATCREIDGCALAPCHVGVDCTDVPAPGTGHTCGPCPAGMEGDGTTCTDEDGCAEDPCFPGVTCTDRLAPETGFTCGSCPAGLEGDGVSCTEVDGCALEPCFEGVACTDVPAPGTGRTCGACPAGTQGDGATCVDVNDCVEHLCVTACSDVPAPGTGYTCTPCEGPQCPVLVVEAGPDVEEDAGTEVQLQGTVDGANGWFTCRWTDDRTALVVDTCDRTVTVGVRTVYTLAVTDASGETAMDTVEVRPVPLSATAGPDLNIESGEKASLAASVTGGTCGGGDCVTCKWTLADGTLVSSKCSVQVSPTATTNYLLEVTDSGDDTVIRDEITVFLTDVADDLCQWSIVGATQDGYAHGNALKYSCASKKLRHTSVGGVSFAVGSTPVHDVRVIAYVSVESINGKQDLGLVWGWQDPVHFYLFQWRGASTNISTQFCPTTLSGMAVKRLDGGEDAETTVTRNAQLGYDFTDHTFACADLYTTDGRKADLLSAATFLLSADDGGPTTGWKAFTTYRIELYTASDRSRLLVFEDEAEDGSTDAPVASFTVEDDVYPGGAVGIFNLSQLDAYYRITSMASLSGFTALAGEDVSIAAGESTTLSGDAELAVPPFSCAWSADGVAVDGACTTTVSPAVTTTYELKVTDEFGNVATDEVTVTVK